ncbi:erythrocyte membrane protein 1 [Plasmodium falciparum IGH-CR14]|uniref:Erythrocyte membrane protein 1 n=2 Tax=Plasmodium falciparum TaxID=5833 RepID=A0A0L1I2N1_PLAFA|nr:erythrocyte membrane protein 1 [Plasmodium falciparum IGH-CR14]
MAATSSGGGGGGSSVEEDAKHVLDKIGQQVYKEKVEKDAKIYKGELEGKLSFASILSELASSNDPCDLIKDEVEKLLGTNSNRYPCANRSPVRFSDESRSQCTYNRIKDSQEGDNKGACAPFRRLSVCDYNLEKMGTKKRKARHNLLAEVCLAAKYEAESLQGYYGKYDSKYHDTGFTICTALARSFADIGDIIRGKDLYLGDKGEKRRLEDNLKTIFGKIYEELSRTNGAEARYKKDEDGNYYQLREDWWYANRETVWKALTCDASDNAKYFRPTCGDKENTATRAKDKCRCNDGKKPGKAGGNVSIVPTYFDYVPQYLRWFEEWAEDFCRKRKHKLQNAKKQCRGENNDKYCSRNGYDCTKTVRAKRELVKSEDCTKCSVLCTPFVKWIDNKKLEFEKQEKKYDEEIQKKEDKTTTTIRIGDKTINNLYVGDFYEKLEKQYGKVENFLGLLNQETTCKGHPEVGEKKKTFINFNEGTEETFSHTEYCETCPWCAKKEKRGQEWTESSQEPCRDEQNKDLDNKESTEIKLLDKDTSGTTMVEKLKSLCNTSTKKNIQTWKCYYDKNKKESIGGAGKDYCVLQDGKIKRNEQTIRPYDVLFPNWINEMLEDSVEWSKELDSCINNKLGNCISKKCNKDCECFKKWVDQKKEEWKQLEEHYEKEVFDEGWTPYMTLEMNLELSYFPIIQEAHPNEKPVKKMEEIIDENKPNMLSVKEHDNSITKFLQHEAQEAQNCVTNNPEQNCKKKTPKKQPNTDASREGVGRSLKPPAGPSLEPTSKDEDDNVEENHSDDDDDNEDVPEDDEDNVDGAEDTDRKVEGPKEAEAPTTEKSGDACGIVNTLFTNGDPKDIFKDACNQKYGKTAPTSWKCVTPSGKPSATTGSICVPPRRRKLYLHDLKTLGVEDGKAPSQEDLLKWFVKSAAVETFFAWHQYKTVKQKELDEKKKQQRENVLSQLNGDTISDEQTPENQLKRGTIPPDFLRLMFYTLGDYRDILYSGSNDNTKSSTYNDILKGDKELHEREEKIRTAISTYFSNSVSEPSVPPKTGNTTPKEWWDKHAQHIWNGMICALTYKDGEEGKKIEQDQSLKTALLDTEGKKPKTKTDNSPDYTYENVVLKEDESGEKRPDSSTSGEKTTLNNPKLSDFVEIPTFFRYLHEWGEEFCGTRKRMLKNVKHNCRNSERNGHQYCSGDGHDCTENGNLGHKDIFADPNCPDCYEQCRKYRKWIYKKFEEYHKQEKKYKGEHGKLPNNSNGDNNCCKEIQNLPSASDFLAALKHCKPGDDDKDKNDEINFKQPLETFRHSKYCEMCPSYEVKCNGSNRRDKNPCRENGEKWEEGFDKILKNNGNSTANITVEMIDRRGPFIKNYSKILEESGNSSDSLFKTSRLFKGLRVQNWKCKFNDQKMDVCKLDKFEKNIDLNEYTTFKVFLVYWLEDFLYGYYILKTKKLIEQCKENGAETCNENSKNDCACVQKWVEQKKEEWKKIRERYVDNYEKENEDGNNLNSFLEQGLFYNEVQKAIKPCGGLTQFKGSCGFNDADSSEKNKEGTKEDNDLVLCLIEKLGEKAKNCPGKRSVEKTEKECQEYPPLPDEEYENEDENEKTNIQPKFCPKPTEPEPKAEDEDGCKPAPPAPSEEQTNQTSNPEQTPILKPEEEAPAPTSTPKSLPKKPKKDKKEKSPPKMFELPLSDELNKAMLSSTIMWSIGIGFATFTYFYLKKKTKSSVGNLFQILQIPKSDYDIPTKLSPNRYIPYTSGKYRGKRYIYLEGDSGTDSGYTDHYSDITSSSESEYEELDINDIYVPGSPKYKTLIEVVLEPSGNNTTASGKNTPSDTQNDIPSGDTPNNKLTDNEWNTLKHDFISNMLQNEPNTEPNILHDNVDNNTHPTPSRHTLDQKPFIMSIHDRDLYTGEEYNYNVNMVNNDDIPMSGKNDVYSGIDLINDTLSGNQHIDIYDELLKRKENELFGTKHPKRTSNNSVAKNTNSDPILNQINLFHKWLDRHRYMCAKLKNKEDILNKLKEEWNKENNNNSAKTYNSDNKPSGNKTLNTDVSIQIDMDNPKTKNEFKNMDTTPNKSTMDTMLDDLEKYNEPYYYDFYEDDIIYHDVDVEKSSMDDIYVDHNNVTSNNMDVPTKMHIEMNIVNNKKKIFEEEYPISDIWNI